MRNFPNPGYQTVAKLRPGDLQLLTRRLSRKSDESLSYLHFASPLGQNEKTSHESNFHEDEFGER